METNNINTIKGNDKNENGSPQNKRTLRDEGQRTFEYRVNDTETDQQNTEKFDDNDQIAQQQDKQDGVGDQSDTQQTKSLTAQEQEEFSKLKSRQKYSEYYYFQKLLGQGAFCSVYQAIDNHTKETIAVKVIRRKNLNQNDVYLLRQEAEILKTMDHQNIVKFKHIREIGGRIFLGMELLKGGQLTELIKYRKDQNRKFTDEEASTIMRQIFQAVAYIHSIGIVHRDLKPDNILVGDVNDLTNIKLGDFGLSAKYQHSSFTTLDQHCGTLIFMAPEVALKKEYSKSVDIWSLGIIMYMLLTGGSHPLFSSKDSAETYKTKLRKINSLSFPTHLSVLAKNLFTRLTKFNIAQRYTAADSLQHPWITRINKTLIPLTLPDKMNNLELENKLRNKMSLMFFASIVRKTSMRNTGMKENNFTDPDMLNYKRLLNKVTKKIDRWYDEKSRVHKVQFERDEEFIEHEQSPTHFETSSDEDDFDSNILMGDDSTSTNLRRKPGSKGGYDGRGSDGTSQTSSTRKNKVPKSNHNSFKLSLLETNNNDGSKLNIRPGIEKDDEEEAEFMQFLKNQDNQKKIKLGNLTSMQGQQNFQRRKSLKKGSVAASPPVKRDQQLLEKRKKSPNKVISSMNPGEALGNFPISGASTQTSNPQPALLNQLSSQNDGSVSPNVSLKVQNQSSYGSYNDPSQQLGYKTTYTKDPSLNQSQYSSVKHASSKFVNQSIEEQLKQQSFINSDRVLQVQYQNTTQSINETSNNKNSQYPQSSSTYISQSVPKRSNLSQFSGGADISIYDVNLGDSSTNTNNNFQHQKRNLKSLRGEEQNIKKTSHKKQNTYSGGNNLYHQSYPQQITTHQINLNDILKKNEGYDQKFLFKKNFIPKQKPVMISNHMLNQQTQQQQQQQQLQQQYQQQSYPGAVVANGVTQSGQNSMQSTATHQNYPFQQMNYKNNNKRSGKKGNKSHSQSNSNAVSSTTNNSTINKKLNQSNMPMNYFTLSVDNNLNSEEIKYKDPTQNNNIQSHKYWNQNQQDANHTHYNSHQNTKNSSSDLPLINTKNSYQIQSEAQYAMTQLPLQKSKTGKSYDTKHKASQLSSIPYYQSTTNATNVNNSNSNYNGVFSGAANLIKEEDSIIVSYHLQNANNTNSHNSRPTTTQNASGNQGFSQHSYKNSSLGGGQNHAVHRNHIEQQQYTFDQHVRKQYEQEQLQQQQHLGNIITSQFQTPNMAKKQGNAKIKGLDLSNGISNSKIIDAQYSIKQSKNFHFSEDLINHNIIKDLALANKSFDLNLVNNNSHLNTSSYAESSGIKSGQSHKRHKSMSNKLKQEQINFANNPSSQQNQFTTKQYSHNSMNHTAYEADFKYSTATANTSGGGIFTQNQINPRTSISSSTNHKVNNNNSGSSMHTNHNNSEQIQNQIQQILIQQIDNLNNSHTKQNKTSQQSGKTSLNTTQFSQYQTSQNNQNSLFSGSNLQQQKGTMPQNGIQGQQVILTDNYVNGQQNQIIKYKNKIIIRQP